MAAPRRRLRPVPSQQRRPRPSSKVKGRRPKRPRFVEGYKKADKLGTGGFGVVWSATDADGICVAVKQAPKDAKAAVRAAMNEVACAQLLEEFKAAMKARGAGTAMSESKEPMAAYVGLAHFMRLIECVDTPTDVWLVFEKGGDTLSSLLFDIQGESFRGSRVYRVRQRSLFSAFKSNPNSLRKLVRHLVEAVASLSAVGIVHADIKPENVLLKFRSGGSDIRGVKLIDFGSSYKFLQPPKTASATTPEYLPPELVGISAGVVTKQDVCAALRDASTPYATDMWSIGAILLEIMSGVPLWMSYTARVSRSNNEFLVKGLFAAPQRNPEKIVVKQHTVARNLASALDKYPGFGLHRSEPASLDFLEVPHESRGSSPPPVFTFRAIRSRLSSS